MSDWQDHFEAGVFAILRSPMFATPREHHFGAPYVSAYQLAVAFEREYPEICREHRKVIGEVGAGVDNLARYLAQQLSAHYKHDPQHYPVEGVWLSGVGLPTLGYEHGGTLKQGTPNRDYAAFSLFRWRS